MTESRASGVEVGAASRVPAVLPAAWLRMLPPHELLRARLRHTALASAAEQCLGSVGSSSALHRIHRDTLVSALARATRRTSSGARQDTKRLGVQDLPWHAPEDKLNAEPSLANSGTNSMLPNFSGAASCSRACPSPRPPNCCLHTTQAETVAQACAQ